MGVCLTEYQINEYYPITKSVCYENNLGLRVEWALTDRSMVDVKPVDDVVNNEMPVNAHGQHYLGYCAIYIHIMNIFITAI